MSGRPSAYEWLLLVSLAVLLVWSGIGPHDRFTWVLEVFPIFIGVPVLICIYPRLRLTPLVYTLIWIHACILMLGGHYTYARVPLGFWMEDWFGFAPESLRPDRPLGAGVHSGDAWRGRSSSAGRRCAGRGGCRSWRCASVSRSARSTSSSSSGPRSPPGEGATDFLGTQGDPWDTQWDMMLALIGSIVSLRCCRGGTIGS